jgi:hypothetical protein
MILKKMLIVCVALALVTVLVGVVGTVSTQTPSTAPTASAATVKSTTATTTTAHPIFLSYEQPTSLQLQSYTGPFVGSINSNVYHYPWCSDAKKILPKNLVTFATVADACAAGYRACKVCDPPACGSPTPTPTPTAVPSASTVATPTPTIMPTSTIAPTSTPAKASPSTTLKPAAASTSTANVAQASVAASSSTSSTPGFEGVYALGALAAVFLALRFTRRR